MRGRALPEQVKIDAGIVTGTSGTSPGTRVFMGIPLGSADRSKAQVLGDTVATETASAPPPATLAYFDSAYLQLLKGGANQ